MKRLLIWAAIALALGAVAKHADQRSGLSGLLPAGDDRLGREVAWFAHSQAAQVLVFEAWRTRPDGGDPVRELHDLGEALAPLGCTAMGSEGSAGLNQLEQQVQAHLPALVPSAALAATQVWLTVDGLRARLSELRARAARPDDLTTATLARRDPFAVTTSVLAPLRSELAAAAAHAGVLDHADGEHHLLIGAVDFPPDDRQRTDALMQGWAACAGAAAQRGVRIEAVGPYRHYYDNLNGIVHDLLLTLPPSALLIALVMATLVRSLRTLLLIHLPVLSAGLAGVATLTALGQPVPLVLLGFAAAFLGIAVENALHLAVACQSGHLAEVRRPLVIGYLTTAVAFAVLLVSGIPALRSLGLVVVSGLLAALACSLWLLPGLIARRDGPPPWQRLTTVLLRVTALPLGWRLGVVTGLSVLLLPGLLRLNVLDDLRRLDGSRPETWAALDGLQERWGAVESSDFLVAEGVDADAALSVLSAQRTALELPPGLVEVLVPAQAQQRSRNAAWNAWWTTGHPALTAALATVASPRMRAALGDGVAALQPRQDVPLVTQATWDGTPFAPLLARLIQVREGRTVVCQPLNGVADPEALAARIPATSAVWIASRQHLGRGLVAAVRRDLWRLGGWMALAMAVLVWVCERRLRSVFAILVPPLLALAWCFGFLGWIGQPLTPFTVMVAAFVAGIGLDQAVFLAQPTQRQHTLAPVVACTLTTLIGVGSLIGSSNPLLRSGGIATAAGLVFCLLACLLLTPLLMPPRERA